MDASLLTTHEFWTDSAPCASREVPAWPELAGHVLFETSGSTGVPKWVALSKNALLISAAAVNRHLGVTADSSWGLALPLHHVGGFGVAARSYAAHCAMEVFGPRWDVENFRNWLAEKQVTHTSLVPTQVHDLVRARLTAPQALRAIVVGGGRLDAALGQAARDLGWPLLASFGMSEAGSQIATQSLDSLEWPYQPGPIPLLPIWEARISDLDILSIAGPALFSGYLVGEKFIPREGRWHVTSDRAAFSDGRITPLGRADSRVKVLGELVDPETIERELITLAGGTLVDGAFAVVAISDERAENRLVPAFENAFGEDRARALLAAYHADAPGFRRLAMPVMLDPFPRSDLGKPRRAEIAAMCEKRIKARSAPPA